MKTEKIINLLDLGKTSKDSKTCFRVFLNGGIFFDKNLKNDEFLYCNSVLCDSTEEVNEIVESQKYEQQNDSFYGSRPRRIVVIKEEVETSVKKTIIENLYLESVFPKPTQKEIEEENKKLKKECF